MKKLNLYRDKKQAVISPFRLERTAYMKKGGTILLTTALSLFALPSLVLQFSLINFLSVLFSMIMALAFGVMAMRETEKRWTIQLTEYVEYVEETQKQNDRVLQVNMESVKRLEDADSIHNSVCDNVGGSVSTVFTGDNNGQ